MTLFGSKVSIFHCVVGSLNPVCCLNYHAAISVQISRFSTIAILHVLLRWFFIKVVLKKALYFLSCLFFCLLPSVRRLLQLCLKCLSFPQLKHFGQLSFDVFGQNICCPISSLSHPNVIQVPHLLRSLLSRLKTSLKCQIFHSIYNVAV